MRAKLNHAFFTQLIVLLRPETTGVNLNDYLMSQRPLFWKPRGMCPIQSSVRQKALNGKNGKNGKRHWQRYW